MKEKVSVKRQWFASNKTSHIDTSYINKGQTTYHLFGLISRQSPKWFEKGRRKRFKQYCTRSTLGSTVFQQIMEQNGFLSDAHRS